jgi:DNA-binding transcriptional ArsR family regulator
MRARKSMAVATEVRQAPEAETDQAEDGAVLATAADVLAQLADPTRLHLVRLLGSGEQDVSTLTEQVAASRSSVSQHLGRLRLAGLVRARRDGRRMLYRVTSGHHDRVSRPSFRLRGAHGARGAAASSPAIRVTLQTGSRNSR